MKDELGDRMKENYENRTRIFLPRRTYTIIRIVGKAFHTYTKGLNRPFDEKFIEDMDETACFLCKKIQGAIFAFVQSDEISILLTDFKRNTTNAWFDGNIQKIVSVSASLATAKFNQLRQLRYIKEKFDSGIINVTYRWMELLEEKKIASFDSRTFSIPQTYEVINYFIWRQQDTVRNSIQSVAQTLYRDKELENKNVNIQQEMIFQKGINWNDYSAKLKRGRFIEKIAYRKENDENVPSSKSAWRTKWVSNDCPIFTQDKGFLSFRIPTYF